MSRKDVNAMLLLIAMMAVLGALLISIYWMVV
jgi:hypothetical protein